MNKIICCVAGRSGGHILPCLSHAKNLLDHGRADDIIFVSTASKIDLEILSNNTILKNHIPIDLDNIPKNIFGYPVFGLKLFLAFLKSLKTLIKFKPSEIVSTGGYISIPVAIASLLLRIPVTLYELNATPGRATKFLAPIASKINVCFEGATKYFPAKKCTLTDYPISHKKDQIALSRKPALIKLGLKTDSPTLLVLGGSQGSKFINQAVKELVKNICKSEVKINIIHQIGAKFDDSEWKIYYTGLGITALTFGYTNNLDLMYKASDLVICRSGAGALFDTKFFGRPCITIPLETKSNSHQLQNALAMVKENPNQFSVFRQLHIKQNPNEFLKMTLNHLQKSELNRG